MGFTLITFSPKSNYLIPGLLGYKIAYFLIDWLSEWGTFIFLFAAYLTTARAYFNINLYEPFFILAKKLNDYKKQINKFLKNKEIEKIKRKHTLDLKEKIDSKTEEELNLNNLTIKKDPPTDNKNSKLKNNTINKEISTKEIAIKDEETSLEQAYSKTQNNNNVDQIKNEVTLEKENFKDNSHDLKIGEIVENDELEIDEIEDKKNLEENTNYHLLICLLIQLLCLICLVEMNLLTVQII